MYFYALYCIQNKPNPTLYRKKHTELHKQTQIIACPQIYEIVAQN